MNGTEIYKRIYQILKQKNIKILDFCNELNITRQNLARWKTGSLPSVDVLFNIKNYLQVSMDWLLTGNEYESNLNNNELFVFILNNNLQQQKINLQLDIVDRIDLILDLKKEKRQSLADYLGITYQAIGNWKKKNGNPVADTAIKIANYLKVDINWLIFGTSNNTAYIAINILRKLHFNKKNIFFEDIKPIEKYVSFFEFINWLNNRKTPDLEQLILISKELNLSLDSILTKTL